MSALIISFTLLFLVASCLKKVNAHAIPKMPQPGVRKPSASIRAFSYCTTLTLIDHTVVFKGTDAATAALPDARICAGRVYAIANYSIATPTPVLTITPKASQHIDGAPFQSLHLSDQSVMLISDGENWKILQQFIPLSNQPWETSGGSVAYRSASEVMPCRAIVFYDVSGN